MCSSVLGGVNYACILLEMGLHSSVNYKEMELVLY